MAQCCGGKEKYSAVDSNETDQKDPDEKKAEDKLLFEKCLIESCKKLNDNLSWGNAGVLMLAWQGTVIKLMPDTVPVLVARWILVAVTFISGVVLTVIPRIWEDPNEMRRELEITFKAKNEVQQEEQDIKEKKEQLESIKEMMEQDQDNPLSPDDNSKLELVNKALVQADSVLKKKEEEEKETEMEEIEPKEENQSVNVEVEEEKEAGKSEVDEERKLSKQEEQSVEQALAASAHVKQEPADFAKDIEEAKQIAEQDSKLDLAKTVMEVIPSVPEKPPTIFQKIWYFLRDVVGEEFEDLMIFTLSNVAAVALRDACMASWTSVTSNIIESAVERIMYYAILVTIVGIFITIQLGVIHERKLKKLAREFGEQELHELKDEMLRYAMEQRLIKMSQFMLSMVMAWTWRGFIKIFGTPSGETKTPLHLWMSVITMTVLTALCLGVSTWFHILYPRSIDNADAYLQTQTRRTINDVFYSALRFTVGMVWYDAIIGSIPNDPDTYQDDVTIFWVVAVGSMFLSVIVGHYYSKWDLQSSLNKSGLAGLVTKAYDSVVYSTEENSQPKVHSIANVLDTAVWECFELSIYAWGIAGGLGMADAVKVSILQVAGGPATAAEQAQRCAILWLAVGLSMLASTAILLILKYLINNVVEERKKLFKQLHEIKAQEQVEEQKERRPSIFAFLGGKFNNK